jgi:hypothetical protein
MGWIRDPPQRRRRGFSIQSLDFLVSECRIRVSGRHEK